MSREESPAGVDPAGGLLIDAGPGDGLAFETLVAGLSSRFVHLHPGEVDAEIEDALRRVCEPLRIDQAVLWQWSDADPGVIRPTHFYPAAHRQLLGEPLRQQQYPWVRRQMLEGHVTRIATLDDLPPEAAVDRESAREAGIQSSLCLPLLLGGESPVGALGLNTLRTAREWPDPLVKRLELVAQVLTNALARRRHELRLRESEARLELAADAAEAGLWTLDYATGAFWATDRARALFGFPPDEVITMDRLREWVHPDDWDLVREAIERSETKAEAVDVEYRIVPPGASRARWIHSRGRPLAGTADRPGRLSGISFDATARKEAETELRERLEFETLVADLSSRFVGLPPGEVDTAVEDALRRVCEPLGIELAVLWQWSTTDTRVIAPTHLYSVREGLRPDVLSQEQFPWFRREMLAGRTCTVPSLDRLPADAAVDRENCLLVGVRSNLTLPLLAGGEPVGALGLNTLREERDWPDGLVKRLQVVAQVFGNALARKRAEEALRAGRRRLEAAADLACLAFYEVDFDARNAFVDDTFKDVCGVPDQAAGGLKPVEFWIEHLHPEDRQGILQARRQLHAGELEDLVVEYRFLHPARGERWLHHVARVMRRDAGGRALVTFGVVRDVTETRQREEALRRSLAEIERLKDKLQAESDYLREEIRVGGPRFVTGKSPAILGVRRQVEQVAPTGSSVLIRGETGSGKELVAQAIHRLSPRASHVMVKVNCAALPSGLVESELFGREKGAFTGALTRQVGRFEVADGSTLFLDEIGELSLEVQAKLLRVLETGEFERLGNPRTLRVDVRLVAATNRDLAEEVRKGRFREDLYYRLNVFPIRVPPLRERAEDIPQLVWELLEELTSRMGKKITHVPRRTMEALQRQAWPGNVRELRNVIERAAILTTGDTLRIPLIEDAAPATAQPTLAESERELILQALERTRWRIKGPNGAAATLGLNPSTLYSRMKKLGIRPPGGTPEGEQSP